MWVFAIETERGIDFGDVQGKPEGLTDNVRNVEERDSELDDTKVLSAKNKEDSSHPSIDK